MPNSKIEAPPSIKGRGEALKKKGDKRTPAENSEYLDVLAARISDLEDRLAPPAPGS